MSTTTLEGDIAAHPFVSGMSEQHIHLLPIAQREPISMQDRSFFARAETPIASTSSNTEK
jgi:hypothetical protein